MQSNSRNSGSPAMEGILALDPAGPLFESNSELTKLGKNDAKAVQVFHTSTAFLGYDPLCGSVDFYFKGPDAETYPHNYGYSFLINLNSRNQLCESTSGLIVGNLSHLADSPSSAREEVITFGGDAAEPYGCRDHIDL